MNKAQVTKHLLNKTFLTNTFSTTVEQPTSPLNRAEPGGSTLQDAATRCRLREQTCCFKMTFFYIFRIYFNEFQRASFFKKENRDFLF